MGVEVKSLRNQNVWYLLSRVLPVCVVEKRFSKDTNSSIEVLKSCDLYGLLIPSDEDTRQIMNKF